MNILITAPMRDVDRVKLAERFDNIIYKPWTESGNGRDADALLDLLERYKADALITELDEVSETVLDAYHDLMFIGDCRANPANIDVAAATKYRIPVLCTPARNAQAVAELLVGSLVAFMRNLPDALMWTKGGEWVNGTFPYYQFRGNEIFGKTVGFVAMGAVGRTTARILAAFGARIIYYDPYVTLQDYEKTELEELFSISDIVSVHLPVLPTTRGLITHDLINRMKPSAIFINTSRSAVVDMEGLALCLREGKIAGAILDVYDHEPPERADMQIIQMKNVMATPHICGATYEVVDHQSAIILDQIEKWFRKENMELVVFNKEIL